MASNNGGVAIAFFTIAAGAWLIDSGIKGRHPVAALAAVIQNPGNVKGGLASVTPTGPGTFTGVNASYTTGDASAMSGSGATPLGGSGSGGIASIGPAPGTPCGWRQCWKSVADAMNLQSVIPGNGRATAFAGYLVEKASGGIHADGSEPPAGALVWYGPTPGHVAISVGGWKCNSPGGPNDSSWSAGHDTGDTKWDIYDIHALHSGYLGWSDGFLSKHTDQSAQTSHGGAKPWSIFHGGNDAAIKWAKDFLTALGAPITNDNVTAVYDWQRKEGGGGAYNPLNTTQPTSQVDPNGWTNSVGVKSYLTYQAGIAATVETIKNGYYKNILAALSRGNDAQGVRNAIANSPWGSGQVPNISLGQ